MNYRILIVDDEKNMCRSLEILLSTEGYKTTSCENATSALKVLEKEDFDLVITDLTMPGMSGMELLKKIKELHGSTQVIMMTAYSTVQSAIEAIKIGAYDYLIKPFSDDDILMSVKKALEVAELRNENVVLKELLENKEKRIVYVTKSSGMKKIMFMIEKSAPTPSNILITGESGSGKEVLAKLIHQKGPWADKRFFAINCASIPENLLESELFGHEKGAFTGALKTKKDKFELAPEGIIFLDEIAEMPLPLQAKLLRVIENKKFERLGGVEEISFSSRIVAATNKNLKELVKEGKFRDDLFYRLNVVHIDIPPLRERKEDLDELIEVFLTTKSVELGIKQKQLSTEARARLMSYNYPGNIRELSNIIESSLIISKTNTIKAEDLALPKQEINSEINSSQKIELENGYKKIQEIFNGLEESLIKEALNTHKDIPNEDIAKLLGTTRRVLESRIKAYNIKK